MKPFAARESRPPAMSCARTDTLDLFLCLSNSSWDPALLHRYKALLDANECLRLSRYRFEQERRTFLISHALVRAALSQFVDIPPYAWRFRKSCHGRPEIDNENPLRLRFSLSHTSDLVACVVTRHIEMGVDIEIMQDFADVLAIAERFFAPPEVSALRALPIEKQIDRFYSTWTLKEAYAKARGLGLSLPLNCARFQVAEDLIEAKLESETADQENAWAFGLMRPTARHWLAIAALVGSAVLPQIRTQWLVPLSTSNQASTCPIVAATRLSRETQSKNGPPQHL